MTTSLRPLFAVYLGLLGAATHAADWPRWRGPALNGISTESTWGTLWPASGPRVVWRTKVGLGFATVSVAQGRVYTTGNAKDHNVETDTIFCFDAATGRVLWKYSYPCELRAKFYEGGTSATPTVDGNTVFHLSKLGHVFAFDAATGKILWQKNLVEELGVTVPEWGFAGSPLVEGDLLILNFGSAGTALDKKTGKVVWISGNESSGYATPVPFNLGTQRCVLIFTYRALVALDARSGLELWRRPWQAGYDTNCADPLVHRDRVFVSSHSNDGALLDLKDGAPVAAWKTDMRVHLNAPVAIGDFLYGFSGSAGQQGELRCVDLKTGQMKWAQKGMGTGSLMAAAGRLVILSDKGELVIALATPTGFTPYARAQVLGGKCWTVPVLANGQLYCRNAAGDLVCLDVRAPARAPGVK